MFVISLSNQMVTVNGLGGPDTTWRKWDSLESAVDVANRLNARFGLNAYVHPFERTDRTLHAATTYSFGYDA